MLLLGLDQSRVGCHAGAVSDLEAFQERPGRTLPKWLVSNGGSMEASVATSAKIMDFF